MCASLGLNHTFIVRVRCMESLYQVSSVRSATEAHRRLICRCSADHLSLLPQLLYRRRNGGCRVASAELWRLQVIQILRNIDAVPRSCSGRQAVKCIAPLHCGTGDKKLSYRRGTARCVVSIEILPIATQQCRNYSYDKSWPNRWYEVGDLVGGNAW